MEVWRYLFQEVKKQQQQQSAGKAKNKGKESPNPTQEMQEEMSPGSQGSNKQKKNKQGGQNPEKKIPSLLDIITRPSKKLIQQGYLPQNSSDKRQQHVPVTDMTDSYTEMTVHVPKPEHVYIIGPRGRHLKDIRMVTGVAVSVPPLNSQAEDIVLRGDKMQFGHAVTMMFTNSKQAQDEIKIRPAGPISPMVQGQFQNQNYVGQDHMSQEQRKAGHLRREDPCFTDNQDFNINVSFNSQGQAGQHDRHVTPVHQGHPQGHLQSHPQGHFQHHPYVKKKFNKQELEKSLTTDNNEATSQDSDPEVVIESEEIVDKTGKKGDNKKDGNPSDKLQKD